MIAIGAMLYFGLDYTVAVGANSVSPTAVEALNLLALKLVLPFEAGRLALGIAGGLAILRGLGLPNGSADQRGLAIGRNVPANLAAARVGAGRDRPEPTMPPTEAPAMLTPGAPHTEWPGTIDAARAA